MTGSGTLASLVERVRSRLATEGAEPTPARVAAAVRAEGGLPGDGDLLTVLRALQDELAGAGALAPLLRDPAVTDVLVNAPDQVWVDRGLGLVRAPVCFPDEAAVRRLVLRLLAPTGRRLDAAQPYVDARLPDGTRLHAVLPPVAPGGTCVSLRVPRRRPFDLDGLRALGTVDEPTAAVLAAVLAARLAVVVSGGTGTGKTTLLSALLGLADPGERLVLVEDAGELLPDHPHVVRLEARPPNLEGAGAVTLRDLVRQALRMRPDRLVVGEVRGAEVVEMLAALNTGHDGGLTTVHANAPAEVPARLEALAAMAGLGREALHSQVAAGLQVVVHLRRVAGLRQVAEVGVFGREPGGRVTVESAWLRGRTGRTGAPGAAVLAGLLADRGVEPPVGLG